MDQLVAALFLALVTERLTDYIALPIVERLQWDKFYLKFFALALGGGLAWLSMINLMSIVPSMPDLVGRILSAIIVGGGSNLIHDLFDKKPTEAPKP